MANNAEFSEAGGHPLIGAEAVDDGFAFRVWAPKRHAVTVETRDGRAFPLEAEADGYFAAVLPLAPGDRYQLRLDADDDLLPDPASRFQPEGLDGPSELIDPRGFRWTDRDWRGLSAQGQILYEMHVGTFTPGGSWRAAIDKLGWLADMGITAIELLPIAEAAAAFGWGYDGVLQYAPTHLYGRPEDLRAFIDAAHARGIGVVLDVAYNHLSAGAHFDAFADAYFRDDVENQWGRQVEFRRRRGAESRAYFVGNAVYWIAHFHLDGLRIDAAHAMIDDSEEHVLAEIARRARAAAGDRQILLIAENERQDASLARPPEHGGAGLNAIWNEDFHHSAMVVALDRREAYMHDHAGAPQEFVSAAKYGFLFQGQRYDWQDRRRGHAALDLRPASFVNYLQNHDQIANSADGQRFTHKTSPAKARVLTALLLLFPQTPMLFQGQEFGAETPFHYFLGAGEERAAGIRRGRREFVSQFQSLRDPETLARLPEPGDPETFRRSKLDWREATRNAEIAAFHRDLIHLRQNEPAIARQPAARDGKLDGAVVGDAAFLLRYFGDRPVEDRLLLANLGRDLPIRSIPDPLAAPPEGLEWVLFWSSEDRKYDGDGRRDIDPAERFTLTGDVVLLFRLQPGRPPKPLDRKVERRWQYGIF